MSNRYTGGNKIAKRLLTGPEYEEECARILRNSGYKDIRFTKATGDQGLDITAVKNGVRYGIQCKYYVGHPVGNKAVQEAYAGSGYYGCDRAVVMTNSTFTSGAVELAEELGVELWDNMEPGPGSYHQRLIRIAGEMEIILGIIFFIKMYFAGNTGQGISAGVSAAAAVAGAGIITGLAAVFNFRLPFLIFVCSVLSLAEGIIFISAGEVFMAACFIAAGLFEAAVLIILILRQMKPSDQQE